MTRRRLMVLSGVVPLLVFGGLNRLAYLHARSFTEFAPEGRRTGDVRDLPLSQKLSLLARGTTLPRPAVRDTPAARGLAFETHRFVARDGVRLEAWRIPAAAEARGLVLLFHGYADSKSSLLAEAAAVHDFGYDVLLVDFRGSGGSDGHTTTIGFDEAQDVYAAALYAGRWPSSRRLFLFGASMGGAAVLRAAAVEDLPVRGLVVQASFASLLSAVENRFDLMGVPPFPGAHLLVFWGGWQRGFDAFAHEPARYAARVRLPVLLLQGGRDAHARPAEAQAIYEHLAGPRRLVLFPKAAHQSLLRHDRRLWRESVGAFLES